MSESETESVEAVEVKVPDPKKTRQPMSDERRKKMLENLAKGRKKRAENLSNKRLEKEQSDLIKEKEHKCDYCGSQFKYKTSKIKHMKTCKDNPNYVKIEDKPLEVEPVEPVENVKVERKEKEKEELPKPKVEKKKKKKVVYKDYSSSDSSSEEEIIYKRKKPKRKGTVVYLDGQSNFPQQQQPRQPVQQAPPKPQITPEQKALILKKRQEEQRYIEMGKKQEANANRIKQLSTNMLRKNRF